MRSFEIGCYKDGVLRVVLPQIGRRDVQIVYARYSCLCLSL